MKRYSLAPTVGIFLVLLVCCPVTEAQQKRPTASGEASFERQFEQSVKAVKAAVTEARKEWESRHGRRFLYGRDLAVWPAAAAMIEKESTRLAEAADGEAVRPLFDHVFYAGLWYSRAVLDFPSGRLAALTLAKMPAPAAAETLGNLIRQRNALALWGISWAQPKASVPVLRRIIERKGPDEESYTERVRKPAVSLLAVLGSEDTLQWLVKEAESPEPRPPKEFWNEQIARMRLRLAMQDEQERNAWQQQELMYWRGENQQPAYPFPSELDMHLDVALMQQAQGVRFTPEFLRSRLPDRFAILMAAVQKESALLEDIGALKERKDVAAEAVNYALRMIADRSEERESQNATAASFEREFGVSFYTIQAAFWKSRERWVKEHGRGSVYQQQTRSELWEAVAVLLERESARLAGIAADEGLPFLRKQVLDARSWHDFDMHRLAAVTLAKLPGRAAAEELGMLAWKGSKPALWALSCAPSEPAIPILRELIRDGRLSDASYYETIKQPAISLLAAFGSQDTLDWLVKERAKSSDGRVPAEFWDEHLARMRQRLAIEDEQERNAWQQQELLYWRLCNDTPRMFRNLERRYVSLAQKYAAQGVRFTVLFLRSRLPDRYAVIMAGLQREAALLEDLQAVEKQGVVSRTLVEDAIRAIQESLKEDASGPDTRPSQPGAPAPEQKGK